MNNLDLPKLENATVKQQENALRAHIANPDIIEHWEGQGWILIPDVVILTTIDSHFTRHALRAICSSTSRYNDAQSYLKQGLPVPWGLWRICDFKSLKEAQNTALDWFVENYDSQSKWPNCTMPNNYAKDGE